MSTDQIQKRNALKLLQALFMAMPDLIGLVGLSAFGAGVSFQFGTSWALISVGVILMATSAAAGLRGDR